MAESRRLASAAIGRLGVKRAQIGNNGRNPRLRAMKQIYGIMAFTFAALVVLSLWLGLSDVRVTRDIAPGDSESVTTGQGR